MTGRPAVAGASAPATPGRPGGGAARPRVLVTHPSAELYGSDRMLAESVHGLVDAGTDVVVALPSRGPLVPLLEAAGATVVGTSVPVLRKSSLRPAGALRLAVDGVRGLVGALALLRAGRPAAVYVSTQVQPLWLLAGRLAGVPVVGHVHEAEGAAARLLRRALASPLRGAATVLVNSRYAGDVLVGSEPALAGRPVVVPNGVAGPPDGPTPLEVPAPGAPVRLVYVGRLSERKGVLVAVEALAELRRRGVDASLDLVGDVFAEHAAFGERLDAALADPALVGHVHRHGFVPAVWPRLAAATVVLVPSLLPEPFGNTAVEAVLAGRPVVASSTGGLPEALAGCGASRLVPPGEPGAVADAVEAVLAGGPRTVEAAARDAVLLADRHAPGGYREAVAGAVLAAVAPAGAAR
ncbi:glycosyltransferase involved in cell wall biosynthesis [Pseudokineococcus lusitanus]|uniref:Glycosyltransferase involved in cell wall biosynthesis n=1 Tax=Pseudokineococcus lusitanus TaxID=763993 RepID=A0A3N1HKH3_9ACTN|nr:glycosyltransferase involved in cell wall biosynthesis [Pseudokineococcus lusitanus]